MISAPQRGWPLAIAVVAAFAVGASAGAYGWSVRDRSREATDAELLAGPLTPQRPQAPEVGDAPVGTDSLDVSTSVFNSGDEDVTVVGVLPPGWTVEQPPPSTPVPAGEWASIPLTVRPDCTEPRQASAIEFHLDAGSGGGRVAAPVITQESQAFWSFWLTLCRGPGVRPLLHDIEIASADEALDMRIPLHLPGWRTDEVTVRALDSSAPAFQASASGLPVRLAPGDTTTVTLRWTVEECASADLVGDVRLSVRTGGQGSLFPLSGRAVAALARFGVAACAG